MTDLDPNSAAALDFTALKLRLKGPLPVWYNIMTGELTLNAIAMEQERRESWDAIIALERRLAEHERICQERVAAALGEVSGG